MSFSPVLGTPRPQYVDTNGDPAVNYTLTFYTAGTTDLLDTYTDSTGGTANDNPLTLNSRGQPESDAGAAVSIYGPNGSAYKIVRANAAGTVVETIDNVYPGITLTGAWENPLAASRTTATSFTIVGLDKTSDFHSGRRAYCEGGADRYATIASSEFTGGNTVVTVQNVTDGATPPVPSTLNTGMTQVSVSIIPNHTYSAPHGLAWVVPEQINVTGASTISQDIIIQSGGNLNITAATTLSGRVKVEPGGTLTLDATTTFTGSFEAGPYTVFAGSTAPVLTNCNIDTIYVNWFGASGDNSTNNATPFANLAAAVNAMGGNCVITYPPGTYLFNPDGIYAVANAWRKAIEFVDVEHVTIFGYGANLKQNVPGAWENADPANYFNDEGPIQFRTDVTSGAGACNNIRIYGLKVEMQKLAYNASHGDGNTYGIGFKGVYDTYCESVTVTGAGTDGIYYGATYSDTYGGRNHVCHSPILDNNQRQGASVVKCDDVHFLFPRVTNTGGGSFGHGIDFEADAAALNDNVSVFGGYFENNERGAFNFIRTTNANITNNTLNESNASQAGAIYVDGGTAGYECNNIRITHNQITTTKAALYIGTDYWDNIIFNNNYVLTTGAPNDRATIRINPAADQTNLGYVEIRDNLFRGTGGVLVYGTVNGSALTITGATAANPVVITASNSLANGDRVWISSVVGMIEINARAFTVQNVTGTTFELAGEDGTGHTAYSSGGTAQPMHEATCLIEGNEWQVSQQSAGAATDVFQFNSNQYCDFKLVNNRITIGSDVDPATSPRGHTVTRGLIEGNKLIGTTGARFFFKDTPGNGTISTEIRHNEFSEYFYYAGAVTALDLKKPGAVISYDSDVRIRHGAFQTTVNGVNARVGDVTRQYAATTGNPIMYRCTVAGDPGTWVGLVNKT